MATRKFSLDVLAGLVNRAKRNYDVLLHESKKWIDWESNALLPGDAKIMEIAPKAQWPLKISFSGSSLDEQAALYDPNMEFYIKTR